MGIPSMQIVYVLLLAFWTSAEVLSQKSKHAPVDAAVGHSSFPEPASNSKVAALLSRSVADGGRVNQQTLDSAVSGKARRRRRRSKKKIKRKKIKRLIKGLFRRRRRR